MKGVGWRGIRGEDPEALAQLLHQGVGHHLHSADTQKSQGQVPHCKDTIPKIRNQYSQKRIARSQSQTILSAYSAEGKYVDRSSEYTGCGR
jgi:hypothetical protein